MSGLRYLINGWHRNSVANGGIINVAISAVFINIAVA